MSINRRLAAIMVADVVGYSRMMEADEAGTLAALKERRKSVLEPVVKAHGGRIVKVMGDGVLVEFGSAVNAVQGAIELQKQMAEANAGVDEGRRIELRIGINLGDVIGEGSDIYGEGVNIAARLEALAEPGGICISDKVQAEARGKIDAGFVDMGDQQLKNIDRPVRAYRSRIGAAPVKPALALPDRPSIAVLPFQNMSGDVEQEYFADGMVEEIITALSRVKWLFVIARNSSFTYKGRNVDVKQVGREMGVRYVLEGSVRKSANRLRITGQLIDVATGTHIWADRFDGGLEDVFDLQDRVTESVVGAISPKLEQAEIARSRRKPTESLDAYDYYLRGLAGVYQWTREATEEALGMLRKATELDPGFAAAYGMAGRCYTQRKASGWDEKTRAEEKAEAERVARRAIALGGDDAVALCTGGIALAYVAGDLEGGGAAIEKAIALNPNMAWAWLLGGWMKVWFGEPEAAIERINRAMRLSPSDPHVFSMQGAMASAHFAARRYDEALIWAERAIHNRDESVLATITATASAALLDDVARAEKLLTRLKQFAPNVRVANIQNHFPLRREEDLLKLAEGLRKAGLPE